MKKTFQLAIEGKNRDRVLDATKHEIRKYLKRERRRAVPEGAHHWDFDCRFGITADAAEVVQVEAITSLIDGVAQAAGDSFYIEILAKPGYRRPRPVDAAAGPVADQSAGSVQDSGTS